MKIAILDGAVLNPGDVDWGPIASLGDVSIYETTPTEAVAAVSYTHLRAHET